MPRLESLAMDAYLGLLESFCTGFIRLSRLNNCSTITSHPSLMSNAIRAVKTDLDSHLRRTASSTLRQEMIDKVLRGKFPRLLDRNDEGKTSPNLFDLDGDTKIVEEMRQSGEKCSSICCTGYFVCESMLAVLVNIDVRELDFSQITQNNLGGSQIKRYVHFQLPAVITHYTKSLALDGDVVKPKLERLRVTGTGIPTRMLASKKSHFEVLTKHEELFSYLHIPAKLSSTAYQQEFGAYAEHLVMSLGQMFSSAIFSKLTELVLGREACNTSLQERAGLSNKKDISIELFRRIGQSCPNIKVIDLTGAFHLSPETLLFLFFKDAYHALHPFVYIPDVRLNFEGMYVQDTECEDEHVKAHNELTYCPWCPDNWAGNCLRAGHEFSDIQTPVLDDRIYNGIKSLYGEKKARKYLQNVISTRDLCKSVDSPAFELQRREGPFPWDENFEPPNDSEMRDYGWFWCEPEPGQEKYKEVKREGRYGPVLNDMCKSLQYLKLNSDGLHPKHEIIPFLLKILPKVKSLGHVNVVYGLKMIRDIVGLESIKADRLEEIDFCPGGRHAAMAGVNWVDHEISDFVTNLASHLFDEEIDNVEERKELLAKDVKLVAEKCPNLRKMQIILFSEEPFLIPSDSDIWKPFSEGLPLLTDISLFGHDWSESVALFSSIGSRLTKLSLSLDGRGVIWPEDHAVSLGYAPYLEDVLDLCPNLESLTFSLGIRRVQVASSRLADESSFPNLKHLAVHTFMTKRAFNYLWTRAPNLETLKIRCLSNGEIVANNGNDQQDVEFDKVEIARLFRANRMSQLTELDVLLGLKDIEAARTLLEYLQNARSISTLYISVNLPTEEFPDQEQMLHGLASVMQSMRQFKLYCRDLEARNGLKVQWKWNRHGYLETFAEIEQLNALIDPN